MHHNSHCCRDPGNRFFERLSQNPNLEQGLHRLEDNPAQDPAVRQLAGVMLGEVERAKKTREDRKVGYVIGSIAIGIFVVIWLIVKLRESTRRDMH